MNVTLISSGVIVRTSNDLLENGLSEHLMIWSNVLSQSNLVVAFSLDSRFC